MPLSGRTWRGASGRGPRWSALSHPTTTRWRYIPSTTSSSPWRTPSAPPGARRESLDAYIKRLEKLEELAQAFNGVSKAYAIQAGREVRVVLSSNNTDDGTVHKLAYDIARKIEAEMKYPGQIKVNVSRETRATEFAK